MLCAVERPPFLLPIDKAGRSDYTCKRYHFLWRVCIKLWEMSTSPADQNTTLKEISRRLGISPSTVSRALSGQDLKRPQARQRAEEIRRLAAELGYAPNSIARSLKTNQRRLIGLIIPDIMNDYYATAATLVQETLAEEDYRVMLCVTNDDPRTEAMQMRVLREERVAGIIRVPAPQDPAVKMAPLRASPIPVVELVRRSSSHQFDAVLLDDVQAGFQGTAHLLELGHREIAIVLGPLSVETARQRLEGYRLAFERAQVPVNEALICSGPYRREVAYSVTLALLDRPHRPTAIIATSNELVIGTLQALAERGMRVPEEISLVGFGNADWFTLLRPSLTTVALPIRQMAVVAAHTLLARIRALHDPTAVEQIEAAPVVSRYATQLIVRQSTQPPAHGSSIRTDECL